MRSSPLMPPTSASNDGAMPFESSPPPPHRTTPPLSFSSPHSPPLGTCADYFPKRTHQNRHLSPGLQFYWGSPRTRPHLQHRSHFRHLPRSFPRSTRESRPPPYSPPSQTTQSFCPHLRLRTYRRIRRSRNPQHRCLPSQSHPRQRKLPP